MKKLACMVAMDLYEWDKRDIESMVEGIGCLKTVLDFLEAYGNTFGLDMKDKIEWALLSEE